MSQSHSVAALLLRKQTQPRKRREEGLQDGEVRSFGLELGTFKDAQPPALQPKMQISEL